MPSGQGFGACVCMCVPCFPLQVNSVKLELSEQVLTPTNVDKLKEMGHKVSDCAENKTTTLCGACHRTCHWVCVAAMCTGRAVARATRARSSASDS